jgi:nucleoid-associated protein YgaU
MRHPYRNGRTYTVAEGDTLFNIARYELGKASRWVDIYELNRDVLGRDFNYLTPGTQLALPEGEKSDSLTRQPGNAYRR